MASMMDSILLTLFTLFVVLIVYEIWRNYNLPPGPWGLPIFGYLPWLNPKNPYLTLTDLSKKYGRIYSLSLGSVFTVVLTDPKLIKTVFSKDSTTGRAPLYLTHGIMEGYDVPSILKKFNGRQGRNAVSDLGIHRTSGIVLKMTNSVLQSFTRHYCWFTLTNDFNESIFILLDVEGLICAQGDLWKEHRRFTFNCLRQFGAAKIGPQRKNMESLILNHCLEFNNHLESLEKKSEIDIFPALRHSLGSAVNVIVFGKCWDRDDEEWKWLQYLQEEGPKYLGVAGPLNFLPFFRFFPKYQKIIQFIFKGKSETHVVYKKIIDEQALALKKLNIDDKNGNGVNNILQAFLLEREKKNPEVAEKLYSNAQFYHLLSDLFGAGLDTTVTTLRWYFLYLAKYPSIQEEIRNELHEVLQGRLPTMEDYIHLPLMESSILETMRIRPVVPVGMPHGTLEDIDIEGYRVPKNTMIVHLQWALHMDEKVWTKPSEYNPKRFINSEGKVEKPEHFMPFQIGKRMCVGDELAKMLLFFFCTTTLQKFSFALMDENADLWGECGITLTPQNHKFLITKTK